MRYELNIEPGPFETFPEFDEESETLDTELANWEWEEEAGRRRRRRPPVPRARAGGKVVSTKRKRVIKSPFRPPIRPPRLPIRPPRPVIFPTSPLPAVSVVEPRPPQPPAPAGAAEPKGAAPAPAGGSPTPPSAEPSAEGSEHVRWVQSSLNQILGLRLPVDGVMDAATRSAVRSFQQREGLPVDGIVGPDTERALIAARSGKSPQAGAPTPAEPGMAEPPESAATPPETGMTEPAEPATSPPVTEFDFEWETRAPLRRRPVVVGDGPGVCTCPEPSCPAHGMEQFAESGDGAGEADGFETELLAELVDLDFNEKFDDGTSPSAPESADAVERFIGSEHRDIGDLALGQRPTSIVYDERGKRLTFGEMIALAGDYFKTHFQMTELSRTREGRASIAFARWHALGLPDPVKPKVSDKIKEAVVERYYVLASQNISHFSAGGTAWNTYMSFHSNALATAFEAGEKSNAKIWQSAISEEGFACHFLTDMFSAGHVRTPRVAMRNWYGKNYPDSSQRFIKYMAKFMFDNLDKRQLLPPLAWWLSWITKKTIGQRIKKLGGEAIATFSLGDIVSLAIHDHDNRGLRVVSDVDHYGNKVTGGHRWTAVGDAHLGTMKGAATKFIVVNAVKASFRELERVYDAGKKASGRKLSPSQRVDAVKKAIGSPTFAARAFVPREDLTASANVRLPGTGSGIAPLEWRWGKLGNAAYQEVDITVKRRIADELFARLRDVPDVVTEKGQTIRGVRHAFRSFIGQLRADGIRVLEAAVGKKAN
jgi:hypothetical protein